MRALPYRQHLRVRRHWGVVPDGPSAILLVGCGDVRNLLATVSAAAAAAPTAKLSFVLNDGDVGQLARDAVMLFIAAGGAPAEAVLAIWANHALSASHADLVQQSCVALASQPWPAWLRASSSLGAPSDCAENVAEAAIRAACRAWAASSLSLSHLLRSRAANLSGSSSEISCAIDLSLAAVRLGAGGSTDTHIEKAVRDYVRSGSLAREGVELTCPNVTLLSAPELQYLVYFSSSIVRAVPLAAAESGCRRDAASLHHRLLGTVAPQVTAFVDGVSDGRVAVTLVPGDILVVAAVEPTAVFDFIDTSNVADYVSIPSLVQMCAPLLSLLPHSRLFVESIVFHGKWADSLPKDSSPQAFARFSLGLPLDDHGRMLGLRFLGGSELRRPGTAGVRLVWQPAPRSPVSALSLVLDLLPIAKAWVGKHTEPIHALSTCEWGCTSLAFGSRAPRGTSGPVCDAHHHRCLTACHRFSHCQGVAITVQVGVDAAREHPDPPCSTTRESRSRGTRQCALGGASVRSPAARLQHSTAGRRCRSRLEGR